MSSPFFSDDKGNQIFGQEDPKLKEIKEKASNGKQRGEDKTGFGKFPLKLEDPISVDGSGGDWKSSTPDHFFPYPGIQGKSGFTNPEFTGVEDLNFDETKIENSEKATSELNKKRKNSYDFYEDFASKQFTHLLDYAQGPISSEGEERAIPTGTYTKNENDVIVTEPNTKDVHLGSFIRTTDENEDPTMLGYDLTIRTLDSPLFNGTIESFIEQLGGLNNSEIGSRKEILQKFKQQFFRFIKNDSSITNDSPTFQKTSGVKTYYLRNLGGLDNLNETNDSSKIKSFVDYGNEFITLEFNEDVTQNIGYLASLYKMLSWSRINGKQVIPENLLRFDVDITVTEIRKYNRVFGDKATKSIEVYADLISKYTYSLYECQFFFPTLPHGDAIDMSNISPTEKYQIKFNYKYSTMKFTKFELNPDKKSKTEYNINNRYDNITRVAPNETLNNQISNGRIVSSAQSVFLKKIYDYSEETGKVEKTGEPEGALQEQKKVDSFKGKIKKAGQTLVKDLTNATIREANRQILTQAALLNRTLDNIRNAIPGAGRMSAPTNVYGNLAGNLFANDLTNAARNFVGNSIKSFFTKP